MNKDNETYLKLIWGGSNRHKRCLFSKKAKVTIATTTVVALFVSNALAAIKNLETNNMKFVSNFVKC